ncbi:MAG: hypothetical protein AAFO94_06135 [Bacteroidota bacterium]
MRLTLFICFLLTSLTVIGQTPHQKPTHNFTVNRLLIVNDNDEILMCRDQHVWATPSFLYTHRQYVNEALDSLAGAYGVQISELQLRGHFSYKYDYHPYSTMRNYYVARYAGGELTLPEGLAEVKWVPMQEAIALNSVTSIRQITEQILNHPKVVWGASFMVSHVGKDHPTAIVEDFYPLFGRMEEE